MALASVLLAAFSLFCVVLALPTTPIPVVGAAFAFAAPALALAGVVAGAVAIARAKRRRTGNGLALVGVIASGLTLLPALLTAVTLGLFNLLFTNGPISVQRSFHVQSGSPSAAHDGGVAVPPRTAPDEPKPSAPAQPGAPPPVFPPPPLQH